MRSRKQAFLICGCIGLIVLSLLLVQWAILLYLCPLILLLFLSVLWSSSGELQITASHQISHSNIFEDSTISVTLQVTNNGEKIHVLELYDELSNRVFVKSGSNYAVLSMKPRETITFSYEVSCPIRGLYHIGPLHARERDFFGLFYKETVLQDAVELTVVPRLEKIGDISVQSKVNPYPGMMQTHRAGVATEFHGVRGYSSGDSFKRINWKAFARWNAPMVNEFELESTTDVIIILDARGLQETNGTLRKNPLEYGIRAATNLAENFLKRRDRVGLIVYGSSERDLTWIYPESGNTQLYKVIRGLVQTQASGSFTFQAAINTAVGHLLPKKSLIIFISSLEDDSSIMTAVEALQAQNFTVLIISPSPLDIEFAPYQGDPEFDLARRILSIRRNTILSQLRMTGARVVNWNPSTPFALALKEVRQFQIRR
jgi:uncharacterized protein (DUF58 family)